MDESSSRGAVTALPCLHFHCADDCCMYGADVEVDEYDRLVKNNLATPDEFTGPEIDDGIFLYRTAQGPRGCIFLLPERGCRLHGTDFKPRVCRIFPRDAMEVEEAYQDGYLPCARVILQPTPEALNQRQPG